ncbi:hypothetical protein LINGRAHAP2_LOCUS21506 [Linum grandiflorum]
MASHGSLTVSVTDREGAGRPSSGGQCLCSPTTHPGSFRCRLHRTTSSSPSSAAASAWSKMVKRSSDDQSSAARNSSTVDCISPNSVEST